MRQVKAYAELHAYNEITSFVEAERVVSSFIITNTTSQLVSRIITDLASPRQTNQGSSLPALQVVTGPRGAGKSHLLAFIRCIIGMKSLRGLIADSNILNAIGAFGEKPVVAIDLSFSGDDKESFESKLRKALCETLKHASYFDDEKWNAAVKGEQVFEQAFSSLPLGAQMILFIDNLPNRWRIAPETAEADLDWLALIDRQAAALPLRTLVIRDEEPDGYNQEDPGIYLLPATNLHDVIAKKVLKKTPTQMRELEELFGELLSQLPSFPWSKADFVNCYPVHPVIYEFAPAFRGASQSFSLSSFAVAAVPRVMNRPALSLVTLDEVFDRYEYEFRKNANLTSAFKLYDQIVSTAIAKLPVSERLWAKLILKTLFAFSLAGQTVTASQIADAQMLSVDKQPGAGYERVTKILDHFLQSCPEAFHIKENGKNSSYVLSSVNQTLRSKLEGQVVKEAREIQPTDPKLKELLLAIGIQVFSDWAPLPMTNVFAYTLPQNLKQQFNWFGNLHWADISFHGTATVEAKWRLVALPFTLDENSQPEAGINFDGFTVAWRPGKPISQSALSPLRKLLVLQNLAVARQIEGAEITDDFKTLHEKLGEEVRHLFIEYYLNQGVITDGENISPIPPEILNPETEERSFSAFLTQAFHGLLHAQYPNHPQFKTALAADEAQEIITEYFGGTDDSKNNPRTIALIKQFAVPLGLVTNTAENELEERYELDIFSDHAQKFPYVQAVLGFIDQQTEETGLANVSLKQVERMLEATPFGLSAPAQHLVFGALIATNLIELYNEKSDGLLTQKELSFGFDTSEFTVVRRTSSVSYPVTVLAEWARTLTGISDLPIPQTIEAERRVREALKDWLAGWEAQNLIARFDHLPIEMLTVSAWRALNSSKQKFTRVSALAQAITEGKTDVTTALSRIADVFGFDRNALVRTQDEMRSLSSFLDCMPKFTELRNYLMAAEPTNDSEIEKLRAELSAEIQESRTLLNDESRRMMETKFAEFLKRYSEYYAASHEANVGPSANRELIANFCASPEWTQFRLLMDLKIEGGAFERDSQALLKLAQETRCDLPVIELLQHQPYCCCSFRLHRRVHLGSLLDALKAIASAASTFYSLAIWRHRSELRTKVKDVESEALQFELEDFLAACGSGDLTELTPELVQFINEALAKEPYQAMAGATLKN